MSDFPKTERGFFHLTPKGWVRQDDAPFPDDRCETWRYEMEWPHEDAKELVTLTKVWVSGDDDAIGDLHSRFGDAVMPNPARNVTLECRV